MMIRKTLLIIVSVFCTAYVGLNLNFIYSELASFLNIYDSGNTENQENIEVAAQTYTFPTSGDKIKTVQKPATAQVKVINSTFRLSIPSLGVVAPIIFEPTTSEQRIYTALQKGVVHYAETPEPGKPGTSIIIGHSSVYPWYKGNYGYVFSRLSALKVGDVINIENNGQSLSYRVSRSLIFSPTNPNDFELRELESTNGSSIVLMTCWPTGTNAKRVAVRADLIQNLSLLD